MSLTWNVNNEPRDVMKIKHQQKNGGPSYDPSKEVRMQVKCFPTRGFQHCRRVRNPTNASFVCTNASSFVCTNLFRTSKKKMDGLDFMAVT